MKTDEECMNAKLRWPADHKAFPGCPVPGCGSRLHIQEFNVVVKERIAAPGCQSEIYFVRGVSCSTPGHRSYMEEHYKENHAD